MRHFSTLFLLFTFIGLSGQAPVNDDCSGLVDLGVAPACPDSVFFTNVDATASDIGFGNIPTCFNGGTVQNDVWFSFTTSDTLVDLTIFLTGISDGMGSDPLVNPQMAIYRGDCEVDGLAELFCISADNGEMNLELDAIGLTPNVTYFIRVNDYSASATPNWGSFQLCVDELSPANTIDEGGSTACTGELYDSGGPDEDYSNNENNIFTICPTDPHNCINFTLQYYNIEASEFIATDQLIFYDDDEPNPAAVIGEIGGSDFGGDGGGGGVCYMVQASSGCLTVEFISDGQTTFEGFAGSWECTIAECEPNEPITVDENITDEIIADFISTPQTQVTITDINCADGAFGVFEAGDNTDLGLERGLLLTSGDLNWAPGPNTNGGGGNFNSNNGFPGDPDLDYLSEVFGDGDLSNDACIVELDVLAATNELTFEYIFGSDEYPEFVNQFNDIFAFLISGPGITGDPNIGNQQNIAVLPDGSNTLVEINSVNNLLNWEYYRDNEDGLSTEYDGLTSDFLGVKKSLTATAQVQPCSTYHLKLAIADRGDFAYDSGVFISELRGGTPNLSITFNSGIDYLIEDCTNIADELLIELNSPQEEELSFNVVINGSAELGVDYLLDIPSTITFPPGVTQLSFPITPLSDLLLEPIETIEIMLTNDFGCGTVVFNNLVVELHDELVIEIFTGQDTALVCQDSSIVLEVTGASSYFWNPVNIFDNATSSTPTASPTEDVLVTVEGNVGPCVDTDSIWLQIVDPLIDITPLDPTAICQGDSVQLTSADNVNGSNLIWMPATGLDDPTIPNPVASPEVTTEYIVTVDVAGCVVGDTVLIDVSPFDFPELVSDTTICENYSVLLAEFIDPDTTTTTFLWSPTVGLDDPESSAPIATPESTTTYELIATSENGACADTADITITVLPADVAIQLQDTVEICLGETVNLDAITSTGDAEGLLWSPFDGSLSDSLGLNIIATPEVSTQYFATFEVGNCVVFDSVYIRVDSLPNSELIADPEKDPYCQGEIVTLISPTYEPGNFMDIEHMWEPGGLGYQTGDSLWNMVLTTQDTFTYRRITTNRACVDTSEITLNVVDIEAINIEPQVSEICPGESVDLLAFYEGQEGEISWSPEAGLSCTDCLDPTATPAQSTVYTVTLEIGDCPFSASTTINVVPPPVVSLNTNPEVCEGESIQLNFEADQTSTYTWTSPENPDFMSNDPLLVVSPTQDMTYQLVAENECGTFEGEVSVVVVPESFAEIPEGTTICEGDAIELTVPTNAPDGVSEIFSWEYDGNQIFGQTVTIDDITSSTVINFTYIYGPECGSQTGTIPIDVIPQPVVSLTNTSVICLGESVELNTDSDDISVYTWTSTDPTFGTSNEPQPVVSPTVTTTYFLTVDNGSCDPTDYEVTIEVIGTVNLSVMASADVICLGDEVILTATADGGSSGDTYSWTTDTGDTFSGPEFTDTPDETTTYNLTYITGANCDTLMESVTVEVNQGLTVDEILVDPEDYVSEGVPLGETITLTAVTTPADIPNATYVWFADGEQLSQMGQTIEIPEVLEDVIYSVVVTNAVGCTGENETSIMVVPPEWGIPNAFTPNNDDQNDRFRVVSVGIVEVVELRVYNRWGQLVFDNEDPDGWDGMHNGKPAPSDVYAYRVVVEFADGTRESKDGDVTLLR